MIQQTVYGHSKLLVIFFFFLNVMSFQITLYNTSEILCVTLGMNKKHNRICLSSVSSILQILKNKIC